MPTNPNGSSGAVLFDLDGTLLDTARDLGTALNQLLAEEGLPTLPEAQISPLVTDGSIGMIIGAFDLKPEDTTFELLRQRLLNNYRNCLTDRTRLFPGLESCMELLREQNIPWGLVTNKPRAYAEPIISRLLPDCGVLVCPEDIQHPKPDPEGMRLAHRILETDARVSLYIGDHRRDIEAAEAAGMASVAAGWGYIDSARENFREWQATYAVEEPAQLRDLIQQHILSGSPS